MFYITDPRINNEISPEVLQVAKTTVPCGTPIRECILMDPMLVENITGPFMALYNDTLLPQLKESNPMRFTRQSTTSANACILDNGMNNSDFHRDIRHAKNNFVRTVIALSVFFKDDDLPHVSTTTRFPNKELVDAFKKGDDFYTHTLEADEIDAIAPKPPTSSVAVFDPYEELHFGTSKGHILIRILTDTLIEGMIEPLRPVK